MCIVTGKGNAFVDFPIPKGSDNPVVKLHSKGLFPWFPSMANEVHFLVCPIDGSRSGRWEGKPYTVKGRGNEFSLTLEQEGEDIKVLVEHPGEGKS